MVGIEIKTAFVHYSQKIKTFDEIKLICKKIRNQKQTISTLNGSFDLLHVGHIYMIQEAKKQADFLILGLNSDDSYRLYKDIRGPLIDQNQRAIILSALEDIDYIVLFDDVTCIQFLNMVKPDVHCNGAEYGENCVEAETVRKNNGKLHLIQELKDDKFKFSTTHLVKKITERYNVPKIKAVFLDRDGILNVDYGYLYKTEDFKFVDGIVDLLKYLNDLGYKFIIVTNQSGISKGLYSLDDMKKFNDHLMQQFKQKGIEFEDIYYCPHHPENEICDCRKPGFVMWQKAKKEHNIELEDSWSIGDKIEDVMAGKRAGTKTILLRSKYVNVKNKNIDHADYIVDSIEDIKRIILN